MAESIQLKPCPFCGGKAAIHGCADIENERLAAVLNGKYGVHCEECKVATQPFDTEQKAADEWNQRKRSEVLTEGMIETIENTKQTLDNMDDPLEPIKVVSAMKSQSMVLEYRRKNEPDKVNILDYTVLAALWKQIPHKVEVNLYLTQIFNDDIPDEQKWMTYPERVPFGICPSCGEDVDGTKKYCEKCGQALAWVTQEDNEEA